MSFISMRLHTFESFFSGPYLAFATKADEEGYGAVASLFRAAARAEQVHFEIPVVGTTKENLEAAVKGETYEKDIMYPEFLAQAEKENIAGAIDAFEDAKAAETVHAALYQNALNNLEAGKGAKTDFFVCPVCGNVVESVIYLTNCPICKTETSKFMLVN